MVRITSTLVLLAALCTSAQAYTLGIDRGGTGPYFLTNSNVGTYNAATTDVSLERIDVARPPNQPVPYVFLGVHGSSGWNAESGLFYSNGQWFPFSFRAPGTINGQQLTRWFQPSGGGFNATHDIRIEVKTTNGFMVSTIYDLTNGQSRTWSLQAADGAGFTSTGTSQRFYREVALNTFENEYDPVNMDAKYWNVLLENNKLYNSSGSFVWDSSRIQSSSPYWPGDTDILEIYVSPDGSVNGANFSMGDYRGLAPPIQVPEPTTAFLAIGGIALVIAKRKTFAR